MLAGDFVMYKRRSGEGIFVNGWGNERFGWFQSDSWRVLGWILPLFKKAGVFSAGI